MAFDVDGFVPATGGGPSSAFYNAVRDAPVDPTVPAMMEDTRGLVEEFFNTNREFANDAITQAYETIALLREAVLPPDLPDPPAAPNIVSSFSAALGLAFEDEPDLGSITPQSIADFNPDDVRVPNIIGDLAAMPEYTALLTGLNLPELPSMPAIAEPVAPGIDTDIDMPTAPTPDYGGPPDLDEIVIPAYTAPVIPTFNEEAPTFNVAAPQPVIQWSEPAYVSTLKDSVQAVIATMLAGGTGIPEDIENAIWERGAERESRAGQRRIDAAYSEFSARGFEHPQGQLYDAIEVIRDEVELKLNSQSRDVSITQADLEQKNRQFAVTSALDFERIFTAIFLAIVDRDFQIAKFQVENEIQIYNLQITAFNVERQVFEAKIAKFKADLDAALAYLRMFEALVEVEKAKSQLNMAKVAQYEAKVKAFSAQVDAYKALVQAAAVRADYQKARVDVYKAEIDGMVGKINGQRARYEAYDSQVKGELGKVGLEESNARVYATRVQAWGESAGVLFKQADVDLQMNRQRLDWNVANMQRVTQFTAQELNLIQARLSGFQANVSRSVAKYNADSSAAQANLQAQVSLSNVAIAKYSAMLEQWKTRAQEIIQFATQSAESLRASAQIVSTMVSGTLAGLHVSAGISAGASAGQSSSRSSADNTTQSKSTTENSNYSIVHNYQHRT